mmetsp:Transcript_5435/g.9734  ORF Transcript_5435/g.9734 Transcript_5435/m.9734 type:complete len:260 (+) Transcript_5435:1800-2579(+)
MAGMIRSRKRKRRMERCLRWKPMRPGKRGTPMCTISNSIYRCVRRCTPPCSNRPKVNYRIISLPTIAGRKLRIKIAYDGINKWSKNKRPWWPSTNRHLTRLGGRSRWLPPRLPSLLPRRAMQRPLAVERPLLLAMQGRSKTTNLPWRKVKRSTNQKRLPCQVTETLTVRLVQAKPRPVWQEVKRSNYRRWKIRPPRPPTTNWNNPKPRRMSPLPMRLSLANPRSRQKAERPKSRRQQTTRPPQQQPTTKRNKPKPNRTN